MRTPVKTRGANADLTGKGGGAERFIHREKTNVSKGEPGGGKRGGGSRPNLCQYITLGKGKSAVRTNTTKERKERTNLRLAGNDNLEQNRL